MATSDIDEALKRINACLNGQELLHSPTMTRKRPMASDIDDLLEWLRDLHDTSQAGGYEFLTEQFARWIAAVEELDAFKENHLSGIYE